MYNCFVCNITIPEARLEFIMELGVPEHEMTCVKHSQTAKIKGIYSGENGTSDIILCDKIHDDSVRSKFREIEEVIIDSTDDEVDE